MEKYTTVDEYINNFNGPIREKLISLREAILSVAPKAEESISYGMPGYKQDGILIYFAAFKEHLSLFPRHLFFKEDLSKYKGGKGTIQIPFSEPLPLALVKRMVKFRLAENKKAKEEKEAAKAAKKKAVKKVKTATKKVSAKKKK